MKAWVRRACLVGALAWPLAASATPETTLEKCQKTVKSQGAAFVLAQTKAIEKCLAKVAKEIVANAAADASGAANTCASAFRKLENGADPTKTLAARMSAKITAACAPGPKVEHALADVLGTGAGVSEPLEAENLGAYCARFGGDGTIETLEEWIDCIVGAGECAANAAVAAHYPRALEWLDDVESAMSALSPAPADALSALADVEQAIEGPDDDDRPQIRCGSSFFLATGQTTCWDSAGLATSCSATGHDGETHTGSPLAYVDHGDGTITDLNTGLMWEKKGDNGGIHDHDGGAFTWDNANAVLVSRLNNRCNDDESVDCTATGDSACSGVGGPCGFAGYRDWRLPNIRELASLIDYSEQGPSVHAAFDTLCTPGCSFLTCSCTHTGAHWSSTTNVQSTASAWTVTFGHGQVGPSTKGTGMQVRGVRGGS